MRRPRLLLSLLVLCATTAGPGCFRRGTRDQLPALGPPQAATLLPGKVKDRAGWAADIVGALEAHELRPTVVSICAVAAVIGQESGFEANPSVPGLPRLVRTRLQAYASKLGPFDDAVLRELLSGRAPGTTRTFDERIERLKTERDVDLLFRDLLDYHRAKRPLAFAAGNLLSKLVRDQGFEQMNPITTAGSMQVSVQFAEALAEEKGIPKQRVREQLYTREGGIYYGTWRLLGYPLSTEEMLYRFADYNAGHYSSRNAALQAQLAALTGRTLALDGDFLAYDEDARPLERQTQSWSAVLAFRDRYKPDLSDGRIRKDLRKEKSLDFEETETYRAIREVFEKKMNKPAVYARLPELTLKSPKLSRDRSTAWFAQSVDRRYRQCLDRGGMNISPAVALPVGARKPAYAKIAGSGRNSAGPLPRM